MYDLHALERRFRNGSPCRKPELRTTSGNDVKKKNNEIRSPHYVRLFSPISTLVFSVFFFLPFWTKTRCHSERFFRVFVSGHFPTAALGRTPAQVPYGLIREINRPFFCQTPLPSTRNRRFESRERLIADFSRAEIFFRVLPRKTSFEFGAKRCSLYCVRSAFLRSTTPKT